MKDDAKKMPATTPAAATTQINAIRPTLLDRLGCGGEGGGTTTLLAVGVIGGLYGELIGGLTGGLITVALASGLGRVGHWESSG